MQLINYECLIDLIKNTNVVMWRDTLVFYRTNTAELYEALQAKYSQYSENTASFFVSSEDYQGVQYSYTVSFTRFGTIVQVHLTNDEFSIPVLQLYFNKAYIKVTAYGLLFRYCELYSIPFMDMIEDITVWIPVDIHQMKYTRMDYKIDFLGTSVKELIGLIEEANPNYKEWRLIQTFEKWGDIETLYIGSRTDSFIFGRIYDKIEDNKTKTKFMFYRDYPPQTARFEFQMWSRFIEYQDLDKMKNKLFSYMWLHELQDFPTFGPYYTGARYDRRKITDTEQYTANVENRILKLLHNGVDLKPAFTRINNKQPWYTLRANKKGVVHKKQSLKKSKKRAKLST